MVRIKHLKNNLRILIQFEAWNKKYASRMGIYGECIFYEHNKEMYKILRLFGGTKKTHKGAYL